MLKFCSVLYLYNPKTKKLIIAGYCCHGKFLMPVILSPGYLPVLVLSQYYLPDHLLPDIIYWIK